MNTRIKQIREDSGLTQEAFANRIGTARNTIAGYEIGIRTPSNAVIVAICKEFGINEEWLKTGIGEKWNITGDDFTQIAVTIDKGDPKARKLIMDYWHLSPADKELFMNFIERFVKK